MSAAHGHLGKYDLPAAQSFFRARDDVPAFDLNFGTEFFERHDQQIHWPCTNGATARHRHFSFAHARHQGGQNPEARPHLRDKIVGRGGVDDMFGRDVYRAALIRVITRAFPRNHDVHTMIAENALKLDDIDQSRNILEDQSILGQQTRDH